MPGPPPSAMANDVSTLRIQQRQSSWFLDLDQRQRAGPTKILGTPRLSSGAPV
ncbi:hypothetical protein C2857_006203 [Epichloe festucae Fl1]|uniref:Uncharacterized protein n=1 Tax=Epichloe festucae (strain Fl1) TaxID=877507 RepID=A0A7S9KLK4_EPIFF|nr:hypothetical protein C2857_006203 [Epichloe festucae Fl1]